MERRHARDPELLLAHTGWMRALALSLLDDPGAADDVVQDATVAALSHAPAREAELEPWLSRVVRNFAWRRRRGERRRADREALVPPRDPQPTPADTLERLDLQQQVIEAVRSIDEPLRTALVQRYLEGKTSAQISAEQRVPAGTVRWRLKRGIEELRSRLDSRFGSRETWVVLFAPLSRPIVPPPPLGPAAPAATSKVLTGVLAMNAAQFGLAAAVLAVAGGIAWWTLVGSRESAGPAVAAAGQADPARAALPLDRPGDTPRELAAPEAGGKRSEVTRPAAVEAPSAPAPAPADAPPSALVDARFVDEHGIPWAGVRFAAQEIAVFQEWKPGDPAMSGADGRAELVVALPDPRRIRGDSGEYKLLLSGSRPGCGTIERWVSLRAGANVHLGDVVLGTGVAIHGRVVDDHGDAVAGARIGIADAEIPEDDQGHARRFGDEGFRKIPGAESGADGSFVLEGVAPGSRRLWAHAEGKRYSWTESLSIPGDRDVLGVEIALSPLLATDRIAGRVVAPDGTPVAHALMFFMERSSGHSQGKTAQADEQGRFSLLVQRDGSTCEFTASDVKDLYSPTTVKDVHPGTLDLEIQMHEKRWLAVHVRDAQGGAVEGAKFQVSSAGMRAAASSGTAPGAYSVATPDGIFTLYVTAPGYREKVVPKVDGAALPASLDVVLERAPVVRGRVLANGAPVAGATVRVSRDYPEATTTVSGYRCRYLVNHGNQGVRTDAEGRFRVEYDGEGSFWLLGEAEGWVAGEVGPIDGPEGGGEFEHDVELTKGGAIEGRVILPDGRDGEGTILALNHGDGHPRTLRAGPHGSYRVDGLAPGSWQVLAVPNEIDPTTTMYSSTKDQAPIEWSCTVSVDQTTRYDLDLTRK